MAKIGLAGGALGAVVFNIAARREDMPVIIGMSAAFVVCGAAGAAFTMIALRSFSWPTFFGGAMFGHLTSLIGSGTVAASRALRPE